jgi:hypothetical protein
MGLFVALTAVAFVTSAQTANYELGVPFAMSCTGILRANKYPGGVRYNLEPIKGYPNRNEKEAWEGYNDMLCSATLADTSPSIDSPLGKETIKRLLRECSIGKICDITGQVNGLSHDIFFWVIIYTVNPTIRKPTVVE